MQVHVFQCSNNSRRYGYSKEHDGANLPSNKCPGGTWEYLKSIDLNPGDRLIGGISPDVVLQKLQKDGWLLHQSGIEPEVVPQGTP